MPNVFLPLVAPAGNGSGAWVDCSAMGALRFIEVAAGTMFATVNIEISNEAVPSSGQPVASFELNNGNKEVKQVTAAAKWMRATVVGYKQGAAPTIEVGSNDNATTIANLAVTAGDGTAAATDVSAMPAIKTITVGGTWTGTVLIEVSEDAVNYAPLTVFTLPGSWTGLLIAERMRVTRQSTNALIGAGTPLVDVGASSQGSGGGGSFGDATIQRFVAAGGEQDFMITLAAARATDVYSVWPTLSGVAAIIGIDCPDILAGDRTTTQFRVVTSAALVAGDIIDFLIADR